MARAGRAEHPPDRTFPFRSHFSPTLITVDRIVVKLEIVNEKARFLAWHESAKQNLAGLGRAPYS
jgi:hypothetical protein